MEVLVFLALRELRFDRARFLLMGAVVGLIAILMVLLSGLSVGLVNDGVSGLKKLPVTSFAFQKHVSPDAAFTRSLVDPAAVESWRGRPGVAEAGAFGSALANAKSNRGVDIDLALFGVEPGSWLAPRATNGAAVPGEGGILLSATAKKAGVAVGDVLKVAPAGNTLKVLGFLDGQHTFGHVDVGYVSLRTWQQVRAGVRPGEPAPGHVYDEISAVAVRAAPGAHVDLAAGDAAAGTTSMTLEKSFGASPGFTAETSTLNLIQGFLYAISALVVGAFFTVITIHRRPEIAVLRAMGASTTRLLGDSLAQSLILLTVATAAGVGIGVLVGAALTGSSMPFHLDPRPIAAATTALIVLGMVGAATAVLRITRVDPLTALGGNR
jgi:hemin transport system permease protein